MACTFWLWFFGGHDGLFIGFVLGNFSVVVVSGMFLRSVYLLVHKQFPWLRVGAIVALGSSGILLVYFFEAPRGVAVVTIAATFLLASLGAFFVIAKNRKIQRSISGRVLLAVFALLFVSVIGRLATLAFGGGAEAVRPMAATNAQVIATIAANLMIAIGSLGFLAVLADQQREAATESAKRDGLTGAFTRAAFFEIAQSDLVRTQPYSVLMLDVDHFKKVNDTYGHAGGDAVLRHVVAQIQRTVRSVDIVGRYGGEEFCILLPGCEENEAIEVAQRIREECTNNAARLSSGGVVTYSVSIGVASTRTHPKSMAGKLLEAVIERADVALYRAKREGRNRVEIALPST